MRSCQVEYRKTLINRKTGKPYTKWVFIGWGKVPENMEIKGKYGYIQTSAGDLERYDLSAIVEEN